MESVDNRDAAKCRENATRVLGYQVQMDEVGLYRSQNPEERAVDVGVKEELSALLYDPTWMLAQDKVSVSGFYGSLRPVGEGEDFVSFRLIDQALVAKHGITATTEGDMVVAHQDPEGDRTYLNLETGRINLLGRQAKSEPTNSV